MTRTPSAYDGPASALYSTLDSGLVAQLVQQEFGLVSRAPVRLLQRGLNDHYALQTPQGDCVVRVYRLGWRSADDITWELSFVEHLAGAGAPVAEVIRCRDGRWFASVAAVEGERAVAVFRRAPGHYTHFGATGAHRVSPAACATAFGESVAQIHQAANSFRPTVPRFALNLDHLLEQPLRAIGRVFAHRGAEVEHLAALARQVRHLLESHNGAHLDWGPCHGDISGGNSTYCNGQVVHFDFDCGGPGWRAYDLGVFFWSLTINGHGSDVWDGFLRGYRQHRSLGAADLATVPIFATIRVVWLMGLWCATADVLGYHTLHDDYFDREVRRVRAFYEEVRQSTR